MTSSVSKPLPVEIPRFRARFNWPLIMGALLVGIVIYLSIVGPNIAPHDPLQENLILKDARTGEWHIPPFPAFEVTGYPLGSDEFGRDMYSRLLWAVGPTLQMVAVVAAVRLVLGTLIGLIAGWSTGRMGRFFDSLISGALALPGLLVALGTIAVVGVELGLIAFIIGLSITGWAETARIVREQTRLIKGQVYIEAANALGASGTEIVFQHVVRQIQAMLLMLLAFEIGSTLMLTAGLGFLGYYIGGDVWVDVSDFVARRTSGAPELGQMLATAWVRLTDPWGLVSVGSVVFISVLGFNLIGEGLRLRLNQEVAGGVLKWVSAQAAGFLLNIEHYITYPIDNFFNRPVPYYALRLMLGVAVGVTMMWGWDQGWFALPDAGISFLNDTGLLPTPRPDQGTSPAASPTPQTQVITVGPSETPPPTPIAPQVVWTFETGSIFTGAPVYADGTLYATTSDNVLHALAPDGTVQWQFSLPARPLAAPALAADGTLYVTDNEGALNAISPAGEALWRFVPVEARAATSGPVVGPEGNIYYASGSQTGIVQAVSPAGEGLWRTQGETFSYHHVPQVSADGRFVFLWSDAFNAADGTLLTLEYPSKIDRFLVGRDGSLYFRTGHNVVAWQMPNGTPEILHSYTWNYPFSEETLPAEAGITQNGVSWELYTTEFGGSTSLFWIEEVEDVSRLLFSGEVPLSQGSLAYLDDETLFSIICGLGDYSFTGGQSAPKPECHGLQPGTEDSTHTETKWVIQIPKNGVFKGAVYDETTEMLYLTTEEGQLYAVDTTPAPEPGGGTAFELPTTPVEITAPVKAWEFRPEGGFAGAPVASVEGTVFVAAKGGKVSALGQDGVVQWETPLDPAPGAGPLLTPNGLLIPDVNGGLAALDTNGTLLWHFAQPTPGLTAAARAVTAPDGVIYYTVTDKTVGYVQAVSATGEGLWLSQAASTTQFYKTPVVNTAGDLVFLAENVFDASNGTLLTFTPPADLPITPEEFITGENGKDYLRQGNALFEWRRNGTQIEVLATINWQFRAENADNPTFNPSYPEKIQIAPDGNITLWYRYNVIWLTETGESRGQALSTPSLDTTISTVVASEGDTSFTCGITLSPSDPSAEVCLGFRLGEDKPVWRLGFGSSTAISENVLGGARIPAGFVFASQTGVLYGVMEQAIAEAWETARNQPPVEPGGGTVATSGGGWMYSAPNPLLGPPLLGPEGAVYLLDETQTMYLLSSAGNLQTTFALPEPVYIATDSGFDGTRYAPWLPSIMEDGGVVIVAEGKVYALNPDGSFRWEFPVMETPYNFPSQDTAHQQWYLIDRLGTIYAYSAAEGLLWVHDFEEGLKAAAPYPVFGPNGEVYYTITTGGKAKVQALSREGTPLWRVELTTFSFYRSMEITHDSAWVFVDDNLIEAATGQLVATDDLEFDITTFTVGYDGKKYLMAGSAIMEWEIAGNTLQILNQVIVALPENFQRAFTPQLSVSQEGIYWLRLALNSGQNQTYLWANPKGEILSSFSISQILERTLTLDEATGRLTVCTSEVETGQLACRGYDGKSNAPVWQINLEGFGVPEDYYYANGKLYILVDADTVEVFGLELP